MSSPIAATPGKSPAGTRSDAPVFVLGAPRSGTTWLYHMLLSAGNFAVYRTESNVFNLLEPRFGDLGRSSNQKRLLSAWYESRLYTLTGLEKSVIEARIFKECHNAGDFLRIVMEEIAGKQGVHRWADTTPEHLLYLKRIKQTIPNALIIHVIRDGRDVALSMAKQDWIRPLPWDPTSVVVVAGLYWQWMVNKGRVDGRELKPDYAEVRFEDLVSHPQQTLKTISEFIDQDMDYSRIREAAIGSVSNPNTSFPDEDFQPVGRWKTACPPDELLMLEANIGNTLVDLEYQPSTSVNGRPSARRRLYEAYFNSKLYLKTKTPFGRLFTARNLSSI